MYTLIIRRKFHRKNYPYIHSKLSEAYSSLNTRIRELI